MSPIRFRMNRLMAWVVVIALNLAFLRALTAGRDFVLLIVGVVLGGLLQFAVWRGLRRPGRGRASWLASAATGAIAVVTLFCSDGGEDSIAAKAWRPYVMGLYDAAERSEDVFARLVGNGGSEVTSILFIAIGVILPIVGLAVGAGLLARFLGGRRAIGTPTPQGSV